MKNLDTAFLLSGMHIYMMYYSFYKFMSLGSKEEIENWIDNSPDGKMLKEYTKIYAEFCK